MSDNVKLILTRTIHTLIWLFFNVVIFYLLYAVIVNKIDKWLWYGLGFFFLEGIILLIFNNYCPLTLIARKYSDSTKHNFDIYIPEWLAKNNKLIYTSILGVVVIILIYRLLLSS
ncbi:MAG TPA: hypothetical protein PKA90_02830 [Ignavibacteria bacterium]|nr:hypothetical protein [Ignavibacteria bacterium]HMR39343.1 hypothetical protein [Ignavibacteria bacterium]